MSTSQRTHNGGLYCSEGSTHVSRPSVRVQQPPGGGQTGGWLNGYADDQKPVENPQPRDQRQQSEPTQSDKVERQSVRTNRSNESSFSLGQEEPAPQQKQKGGEYTALYCTEGNQVRNRPSVRVHGEKPRGYNILHPNN